VLDVAWWALTRKWPSDLNPRLTSGYPARPNEPAKPASITFELTGKSGPVAYEAKFDAREQAFAGKSGRPPNPGLVLYAHADGGFSVWDPARNYWKRSAKIDVQERLPAYVFSPRDVWDGLEVDIQGNVTQVCNGLLVDWALWIRENGEKKKLLDKILEKLSPHNEKLSVGDLVRISLNDARSIPSIDTPYATNVPILHASSGMKRVLALAYMLLWSWSEHERAAQLIGDTPTRQVVLLFDEIESHLHPRWQRTMLSSLLHVAQSLHPDAQVQLLAVTHSPMVLASAEPLFAQDEDAWFDLDLKNGRDVVLEKRAFVRHGDVSNWLTSEAFDMKSARSIEAEDALGTAYAVLRERNPTRQSIERAHAQLVSACLPDHDPFWVRWQSYVDDKMPETISKKKPPRKRAT
jgi:hypothetical protein